MLAVVVYFSLRIDWARVIGRWFPWALKNGNDKKKKKEKMIIMTTMRAMITTQKRALAVHFDTTLLCLVIELDIIRIDTSYAVSNHHLDGLKVYTALRYPVRLLHCN